MQVMAVTEQDTFHNTALLDAAKVPWLHLLGVGGDGTIAQGEPPYLYTSTLLRAQGNEQRADPDQHADDRSAARCVRDPRSGRRMLRVQGDAT